MSLFRFETLRMFLLFCILNRKVIGATLVVWQTFAMNRKYGQYGLMKKGAVRMHPRYLLNRRTVYHLIRNLQPKRKKQ